MHLSAPTVSLLHTQQLLEQNQVRLEPSSQRVYSLEGGWDKKMTTGVSMISEAHKDATGARRRNGFIRPKRRAAECEAEGTLGLTEEGTTRALKSSQKWRQRSCRAKLNCTFLNVAYTQFTLDSILWSDNCEALLRFYLLPSGFFHFYSTGTKAILYAY